MHSISILLTLALTFAAKAEQVLIRQGQYGLSLQDSADLTCFNASENANPAYVLYGTFNKTVVEPVSRCDFKLNCTVMGYLDAHSVLNLLDGINTRVDMSKCESLKPGTEFHCQAEKVKDPENPLGECHTSP